MTGPPVWDCQTATKPSAIYHASVSTRVHVFRGQSGDGGRKGRLLEEYDGVHVQQVEREFGDDEEYRDFLADARDGYTGGGYAWVVREPDQTPALTESMPDEVDDGRRVLMILGRGASHWGLAGGGREDGETYEEAARREVREETSVECEVTDLFLLRDLTLTPPDEGEPIHTLWAFFDAEYRDGHIAIQPGELNGAAWFGDPRDQMHPENTHRATDFWDDYEYDGDPFEDFYDDEE